MNFPAVQLDEHESDFRGDVTSDVPTRPTDSVVDSGSLLRDKLETGASIDPNYRRLLVHEVLGAWSPYNINTLTTAEPPRTRATGDIPQDREPLAIRTDAIGNAPRTTQQDVPLTTARTKESSVSRFIAEQTWDGYVYEVRDTSFVAILVDRNHNMDTDEAEIYLDEVSEEDHPLIVEGAQFSWSIGYEITPARQRKKASILRFRRLPAFSHRDIAKAHQEAERLMGIFSAHVADENERKSDSGST